MRRHVIIGRLGATDSTPLATAQDEVVTEIQLLTTQTQLGHGLADTVRALLKQGVFPSQLGLDFLLTAALVHAADTRISRNTESQDTWTREIRLIVPVSDVVRWRAVEQILTDTLNFLTGDHWTVHFRSRSTLPGILPERSGGVNAPEAEIISLFSGGLDSLIGAVDLLEQGTRPIFVSHSGDGATSKAQQTCFDELATHYGLDKTARVRFWLSFQRELVHGVAAEDTTRARSFLFFSLAVFVGAGLDRPFVVRAPENGLIALNVPLDPLRLGALSTRTTHPFYIARWNDLLQAIGIPCRIENPYRHLTKGEMAANCANADVLRGIIASSLSCSSPTKGRWQSHSTEHCGYCAPCVIRRAALTKAFGADGDPTSYSIADLRARALDSDRAEGQQVRSFQLAIERLRSRPDLAKLLIHKPGPLSDVLAELDSLAGVYGRGMYEVGEVLSGVIARPQ